MITVKSVDAFKEHLLQAERSPRTAEQYAHIARSLTEWLKGAAPGNEKNQLLSFKEHLKAHYAPASVNAAIAAVNSFMEFSERADLKLKAIRRQKNIFADKEDELSKAEYSRLCKAARKTGNDRLYHILITLSSVGVRVSELQYITVEAVREKTAYIDNKDIVRLADILGHSSIDTTRIYTRESGDVHRRQLDKLCLDVNNV